jgi:hypothetical protein
MHNAHDTMAKHVPFTEYISWLNKPPPLNSHSQVQGQPGMHSTQANTQQNTVQMKSRGHRK